MPNPKKAKKKNAKKSSTPAKRNVKKLPSGTILRSSKPIGPLVAHLGRNTLSVRRSDGLEPPGKLDLFLSDRKLRAGDADNDTIYTSKGRLSGLHDQSGITFTKEDLIDGTTGKGKPRALQWTVPMNTEQTLAGKSVCVTDSRGSFIRLNSFSVHFTNLYPVDILIIIQVPVAQVTNQSSVYTKLGSQKRVLKSGQTFKYIRHSEHSLSDQYVPPMQAVEDPENTGLKVIVADVLEFKVVPAKGEPAGVDLENADEMLGVTMGVGRKGKEGIAYTVGHYPTKDEVIVRREKKVAWPEISDDAFEYVPPVPVTGTGVIGYRDSGDTGIGWTVVDRAPQHETHDYYTVRKEGDHIVLVTHSDGKNFHSLEMDGFEEDTRFYPPFSMSWIRAQISAYEWVSCTPCVFKFERRTGYLTLWDEGSDAPYNFTNSGSGNTGKPDWGQMPSASSWGVVIGTPIRCVYFDATDFHTIHQRRLRQIGGAAYADKILRNNANNVLVRRAAYRRQLECLALGHITEIQMLTSDFWEFASTALTVAAVLFM